MRKHPLVIRTSPMGEPFLGTCSSCGKEGITAEETWSDHCPNPLRYTRERAIAEALEPLKNRLQ